jgi:hypothetical protein
MAPAFPGRGAISTAGVSYVFGSHDPSKLSPKYPMPTPSPAGAEFTKPLMALVAALQRLLLDVAQVMESDWSNMM